MTTHTPTQRFAAGPDSPADTGLLTAAPFYRGRLHSPGLSGLGVFLVSGHDSH